ncbi:MAG: HAD-superfamily hydrolase, subfamily variant 3 [Fluviicola sp.]|jgi:sugar-phosphatase|uniref:hexitol phosphatase HxpB n=1 Tax=Fluviicola sp. TaxID=1917219 RepID=UPI00260BE265|nr:hexitol phosphatase HxpB [Fluviicola sp.]MDF3028064.1 HAD-superfamily hydrolase, subfamily variant 3 [Fluviicola sp.]
MKLGNFDGVIYDMDGVLTDSEPLWKIAMEDVFKSVGCPLTKEDFQRTVGLRIDEVIAYWYHVAPWQNASPKEVENAIVNRMIELLTARATPLPGVVESLEFFSSKGLKIGLATSSYQVLIDCILDTLQIRHFFQTVHSAEYELFGKPHPAVYLTAAKNLDIDPRRCLVIEDSLNGIISGKAARMTVFCVPEKTHHPEPKLILADAQFDDLIGLVNYFK